MPNRSLLVSILVLLLIILGGWLFLRATNFNEVGVITPTPTITANLTPTLVPSPTLTEEERARRIDVEMESTNEDYEQSGTATLTEENGRVRVVIDVEAIEGLTSQPAHIHTGRCPEPGGIVYPLTNVVNGQSVTVLNTTITSLRNRLPLAINIHKSAAESDIYTSCGDLE